MKNEENLLILILRLVGLELLFFVVEVGGWVEDWLFCKLVLFKNVNIELFLNIWFEDWVFLLGLIDILVDELNVEYLLRFFFLIVLFF